MSDDMLSHGKSVAGIMHALAITREGKQACLVTQRPLDTLHVIHQIEPRVLCSVIWSPDGESYGIIPTRHGLSPENNCPSVA